MQLRIDKKVVLALRLLSLEHRFVNNVRVAKNPDQIGQAIEQIRVDAKEQAKKMAMTHHPDRGGDEDKMKEINAAVAAVQEDKHYALMIPRPQPMVRVIHVQQSWTTSTTSATSTSYTTTGYYRY